MLIIFPLFINWIQNAYEYIPLEENQGEYSNSSGVKEATRSAKDRDSIKPMPNCADTNSFRKSASAKVRLTNTIFENNLWIDSPWFLPKSSLPPWILKRVVCPVPSPVFGPFQKKSYWWDSSKMQRHCHLFQERLGNLDRSSFPLQRASPLPPERIHTWLQKWWPRALMIQQQMSFCLVLSFPRLWRLPRVKSLSTRLVLQSLDWTKLRELASGHIADQLISLAVQCSDLDSTKWPSGNHILERLQSIQLEHQSTQLQSTPVLTSKKVFSMANKDGDGFLSFKEIKWLSMKTEGSDLSKVDFDAICNAVGADRANGLTCEHVVKM